MAASLKRVVSAGLLSADGPFQCENGKRPAVSPTASAPMLMTNGCFGGSTSHAPGAVATYPTHRLSAKPQNPVVPALQPTQHLPCGSYFAIEEAPRGEGGAVEQIRLRTMATSRYALRSKSIGG